MNAYTNPLKRYEYHLSNFFNPRGFPKWWATDIDLDLNDHDSAWKHLREVFIIASQVLAEQDDEFSF